nr:YoaK family protein [Microbacterium endophyticum]
MSLCAGYVDGFAFVYLGGYFVSFMSGNTTRASVDLAGSSWGAAGIAFALIGAFVAGAMAGTLILRGHVRDQKRILGFVVLIVAFAATSATFDLRWVSGILLALAMGALNTVFTRDGEISFGVTYMTGALVKLGQGLVAAARGGSRTAWVRHFIMWVSIAVGAALGALSFAVIQNIALWVIVAVLGAIYVIPPKPELPSGA